MASLTEAIKTASIIGGLIFGVGLICSIAQESNVNPDSALYGALEDPQTASAKTEIGGHFNPSSVENLNFLGGLKNVNIASNDGLFVFLENNFIREEPISIPEDTLAQKYVNIYTGRAAFNQTSYNHGGRQAMIQGTNAVEQNGKNVKCTAYKIIRKRNPDPGVDQGKDNTHAQFTLGGRCTTNGGKSTYEIHLAEDGIDKNRVIHLVWAK